MGIPQHIFEILQKRLAQQPVTEQELLQLREWFSHEESNNSLFGEQDFEQGLLSYLASVSDESKTDRALERFMASANFTNQPVPVAPVHRVHFLRRWWAVAAVFVLAIGITTAILVSSSRHQPMPATVTITPPDILPGTNKALLTLSDGSTITLDSTANGIIAQQGNASIVKSSNGEIIYNSTGTSPAEVLMNTMQTPRGGQYQLVLPDGTRVWLNAASSITYPTVFVGNERKVKVTGEVYMEVAKNKAKPFLADVNGKCVVQVLGTSFNINAYADEENIKTTLVEGAVKILSEQGEARLQPGQQAITGPAATKVQTANIEQALAWKNGIFDFEDADLKTVIKQLERWYDIDVKVEGNLPGFKTQGQVDRGVKLSGIIRFLNNFGVNTRLEGRDLIISEK